MKPIQAFVKLIVALVVVAFLLPACLLSTQPEPSETGGPGAALPALTITPDGNMGQSAPTTNPAVCPPENTSFPNPEEIKSHLGWQYLHNPAVFDYPDEEFGALLSIDRDNDYGIVAYALGDNSFMLVLEKCLCNNGAGLPARVIVDAVSTRPLSQDELIYLGSNCIKNGELTSDYQFVLIDESNNGKVYSAWSINEDKKIMEASIEGLSCSFGG